MAIVPADFEMQIADVVAALETAAKDPTIPANMQAARAKYAHGKALRTYATGPGNLEVDLDSLASGKQRLEAAADRLRQSLRAHGILDDFK